LLTHLYSIMLLPVRDYLERSSALFAAGDSLNLLVSRHKAILTAIQHRDPLTARHAAIAQLAGVNDMVAEAFRPQPLSEGEISYDH